MMTRKFAGRRHGFRPRRAAASVELAAVLPMLCFITFAAVDFARVMRVDAILFGCARSGAVYAADTTLAAKTGYASVSQAALADSEGLAPPPTVQVGTGTDSGGSDYVEVTISYTFRTVGSYPGIPTSVPLVRTIRMPKAPG